jgi:uncharacterized protein YgiM (DUF1202 family)
MKTLKPLFRVMLLALVLVAGVGSALAQGNGRVRFVHVVPNVGAVDVYVNNVLVVAGLAYGSASDYVIAPAGDHTARVTLAEQSDLLWEQGIAVGENRATTFIASKPSFTPFNENLGATTLGNTRLLLIHAIDGAPAVDVSLAEAVSLNGVEQPVGTKIAVGMAYDTSFGSFDLPAQTYVVDVTAGDATVLDNVALPLDSGTTYFAIVYGTPSAPEALLLRQMTTPASGEGLVRFIHAVVGAPSVDVFVNDTLVAPRLSAEDATVHMSLPVGTHTVTYRVVNTDDVLVSTQVVVEAAQPKTIVAMDAGGAVALTEVLDDISAPASVNTRISATLLNAIPMSAVSTLNLGASALLEEPLAYAEHVGFAFDPAIGTLAYDVVGMNGAVSGENEARAFYGGTYYNFVIVGSDEPKVLVFPTSLSQTIGSAPQRGGTTVAQVATPAPAVEQPATVTTPPPAQQPPTTTGDRRQILAQVVLNPGANLQLRQFPNSSALSLGLAPSGATLEVNGREGAPVALVEGQAPPPEAALWIDPVANLTSDNEDLDPTQTWLNVTYTPADGGRIVAWVNAQFLDLRNGRGERVKLRDIVDLVGGNVPGRATGVASTAPSTTTTAPSTTTTTTAQQPAGRDSILAIVFGMNPGAGVNIRRYPSTDAEVLGRAVNDTVLRFVGANETDDWAFIEFASPDNTLITGWVSTQFLRYEYNGRSFNSETVKNVVSRGTSQALFEIIPPTRAGDVSFNASGSAPTVTTQATPAPRNVYFGTVQLDPTANLQLRRYADSTSESLGLIPGGSTVEVDGRNIEATWYYVTYNGASGWVSAQFVNVTLNGRAVALADVPIASASPNP